MLVTIKTSKHVWTSPDGRIKIHEFTGTLPDGEEIQAQTRSDKIAAAINQTLDLTTTVSQSGKTYYKQVPKEDGPFGKPAGGLRGVDRTSNSQMVQSTTLDIERFEAAVVRFETAVDNLIDAHISPIEERGDDSGKDEMPLDDDIETADDDLQEAINILDREMGDRINDERQ